MKSSFDLIIVSMDEEIVEMIYSDHLKMESRIIKIRRIVFDRIAHILIPYIKNMQQMM